VLKIFLIDLLFFVSEYRTVSFISLGLILFGASYLYQRYRTTVKQPTPADPPEEPVVQ
jgi:uncharacterized membrane protein